MEKTSAHKNFVSDFETLLPAANTTPWRRIFAIGDIHGDFTKLMSLWSKLAVTDDDLAIFSGDYIDRGAEIDAVLKWVLAQSERKNIIFLRGNHEQMMLDTFAEVMDKRIWFMNGGTKTVLALRSLKAEDETYVDRVLNFAENLPLYHALTIGGRQYIFVHAGIEDNVPLDEQSAEFLIWAREKFFNRYEGDAIVICGHSPVQLFPAWGVAENPRPVKIAGRNILMIDTGSFFGKVSAVDILTGEFWSSDSE